MTNKKEPQQQNEVTTEVVETLPSTIIQETEKFTIHKDINGKYSRRAKYVEYQSFIPETRADKIWLLNLLEGAEDTAIGLKDCAGQILEVKDVIIRPYDSINEESGEMENGVLTYLITPEKQVYVTSAKAVYFSIKRIMEVFGEPNSEEWENVHVVVGKTKMENGDAINIKMVE